MLEDIDSLGKGLGVSPVKGPLLCIEGDIRLNLDDEFVDARFIVQFAGGRAGRLEKGIHDRAQTAQVHLSNGRRVIESADDVVPGQAERVALGVVVGPDLVVENGADKAASKGQVLVPRQERPLAGALCIAVQKVVLAVTVHVVEDGGHCQVVDGSRDVQVIEYVARPLCPGETDAVEQCLQVAVALVAPCLFFHADGRRICAVEHLVQCPI